MKCPFCNNEAYIVENKNKFNSTTSKLYREMKFECRNKKCTSYKKVIGTKKTEIPVVIE